MDSNLLKTIEGIKTVIIFYSLLFILSTIGIFFGYFIMEYLFIFYFIIMIVVIVSLIGIYSGISRIHAGKKAFYLAHERSTNQAKKFVKWGLIIYIFVGFFFGSLFVFNAFSRAIVQTLIMAPFWLALVYLIKEIASDKIKNLLWIAFFSRAVLFLFVNILPFLFVYYSVFVSPVIFSLISIIAIIPSLMFIYCYYKTYKLIKISTIQ
jgi:hypothetical protein